MTLRTAYNEQADQYEVLDDVEGVPIVFAFVDGGTVRGRIANAQAQTTSEAGAEGEPATPAGGQV
jgi:hypothetical protein